MASQHEVDADGHVQARQDSPRQVPHHERVLVLACTVVRMQMHLLLPHAVVRQVVVEVAGDAVGPFPRRCSLIDEVVHLGGHPLSVDSKEATAPLHEEVDGPGLHRVIRVHHLEAFKT